MALHLYSLSQRAHMRRVYRRFGEMNGRRAIEHDRYLAEVERRHHRVQVDTIADGDCFRHAIAEHGLPGLDTTDAVRYQLHQFMVTHKEDLADEPLERTVYSDVGPTPGVDGITPVNERRDWIAVGETAIAEEIRRHKTKEWAAAYIGLKSLAVLLGHRTHLLTQGSRKVWTFSPEWGVPPRRHDIKNAPISSRDVVLRLDRKRGGRGSHFNAVVSLDWISTFDSDEGSDGADSGSVTSVDLSEDASDRSTGEDVTIDAPIVKRKKSTRRSRAKRQREREYKAQQEAEAEMLRRGGEPIRTTVEFLGVLCVHSQRQGETR